VVAVDAFPVRAAVIVPAEKLLVASRATIVLAVLTAVAVVAVLATFPADEITAREESGSDVMDVARAILALPSKFTPVAVTAPVMEIALGVCSTEADEAFPVIVPDIGPLNCVAVIVPAVKFPDESRATMVLAMLALVAVVAVFATFPVEAIVANLVSAIAAPAPI
jgi:hypothetical protein